MTTALTLPTPRPLPAHIASPLCPTDISQGLVDFVVPVPSIGDSAGILSEHHPADHRW